jgi:hypothetical protein
MVDRRPFRALLCGCACGLASCRGGGTAPVVTSSTPAVTSSGPAASAPGQGEPHDASSPPPAGSVAAAAPAALPAAPIPDDAIGVRVLPATVFVEHTDAGPLLNCDLVVRNTSSASFVVTEIEASVYDRSGALVFRKFVSGNGVSPAITTVPGREIGPGAQRLIMNPLHTFPRDLELSRVVFQLTFDRVGGTQQLVARAEVNPQEPPARARLVLPVRDQVIAWSGHDYLSHHRRWDYLDPRIEKLGFDSNAGRYSYDFVVIDDAGAMRNGDPDRNESWFGFGHPVVAPAAGVVVGVMADQPDDRRFDIAAVSADLLVVYGNRVLIEHAPGEVSLLAHLRQGSVKVKVGDRVRAGQEIAAMGASGSALMPHLHYQLQTTATGRAEGLPAIFHDFVRARGARSIAVARGHVDTGEIVAPRDRQRPRRGPNP